MTVFHSVASPYDCLTVEFCTISYQCQWLALTSFFTPLVQYMNDILLPMDQKLSSVAFKLFSKMSGSL